VPDGDGLDRLGRHSDVTRTSLRQEPPLIFTVFSDPFATFHLARILS
jgi:hypothetical protein